MLPATRRRTALVRQPWTDSLKIIGMCASELGRLVKQGAAVSQAFPAHLHGRRSEDSIAAAWNRGIPGNLAALVVFRPLANPGPDRITVADRELLFAMGHAQLWRGAPIEQPNQVAAVWITGNDHRPVFGTLHHPLICRKVKPAFFVAGAARLVTAHTSALEDRQYVLGEALRLGRA
jgi:hypothetical protein